MGELEAEVGEVVGWEEGVTVVAALEVEVKVVEVVGVWARGGAQVEKAAWPTALLAGSTEGVVKVVAHMVGAEKEVAG